MLNIRHAALLACFVAPFIMAAKSQPPGALEACADMHAGDRVTLVGPEGKKVAAICAEKGGKLLAEPECMGKPSENGKTR